MDGWENVPEPPVLLVGILSRSASRVATPGRSACSGGAALGEERPTLVTASKS